MKNRFHLPTCVTLLTLLISARALAADVSTGGGAPVFRWPSWVGGFEAGGRALGHFGNGSNLNAPPGDILFNISAHQWYEHLVEAHVNLALGVRNLTLAYGGGFRVNLLEFVRDPSGQVFDRGLERGLISRVLQNFMIYGLAEVTRYDFGGSKPETALTTYDTSVWDYSAGAGMQVYFSPQTRFSQRWYVDLSLSATRMDSGNYLVPMLSLGIEIR